MQNEYFAAFLLRINHIMNLLWAKHSTVIALSVLSGFSAGMRVIAVWGTSDPFSVAANVSNIVLEPLEG